MVRATIALIVGLAPYLAAQQVTSIFQVVPTPNPQRVFDNYLFAASASSPSDIWAVGTTAIHYDGTSWTGFSLPGINGEIGHQMYAAAALSPTDAWAVGTYSTSDSSNGSILHWNGTSWSPYPNPAAAGRPLWSIAAISSNDIWAGGCIPEFYEHFDGTAWSYVAPGGAGSPFAESCVTGLSALATNDVWSVGWIQYQANNPVTQIQHWNGTQWGVTTSPNVGTGPNQLYGVVALSDSDVWAVGYSTPKPDTGYEYPDRTLIEHWDGTSWSAVTSPNVDYGSQARDNVLQGIVALSANDIYAFGWYSANPSGESGDIFSLVMHWDGTSWTVIPSPDPDRDPALINDPLYGGVVTAPGTFYLVGFQDLDLSKGQPPSGTFVLYTTGQ